jgi:hypothetical protein
VTGIDPGTVVEYHGSRTECEGRAYIVAWTLGERLTLLDASQPGDTTMMLQGVRPASVTPTGEHRALCSWCLRPAGIPSGSCPQHGASTVPRQQDARPAAATEGQDR